jgi:hypothetical protein
MSQGDGMPQRRRENILTDRTGRIVSALTEGLHATIQGITYAPHGIRDRERSSSRSNSTGGGLDREPRDAA